MIRFRKILCPVDFFPGSLRAFDHALKLAKNYQAVVVALHVIQPLIPTVYDPSFNIPDLTASLQQESKRLMKKLSVKAARAGVPFTTEVKVGDVNAEIRNAIERTKTDLVVAGTHGSKGFERWLMGSVTEKLMRHCPVPLLLIGGKRKANTAPPEIRSILVTTDFSDGTDETLAYAFSIAQEGQAKVGLLHVLDVLVESPAAIRNTLAGVRKRLDQLVPAAVKPWCETSTIVATGTPFQVILRTANKNKAGLIVMNVHGKSALDRILIGSTAERVLRGAECPVLLIPPKSVKTTGRPRKSKAA